MMSFRNDFVSGPITAKGVSVAIRSYPKKLQKSRGARRCPSSSPKGSDGHSTTGKGVAKAWLCVRPDTDADL